MGVAAVRPASVISERVSTALTHLGKLAGFAATGTTGSHDDLQEPGIQAFLHVHVSPTKALRLLRK